MKCPQHLFKTWHQGPGVYLKQAFNWGPEFINEVEFLTIFRLMFYFTFFEIFAQFVKVERFFLGPDLI